jgi:hypothetical protein
MSDEDFQEKNIDDLKNIFSRLISKETSTRNTAREQMLTLLRKRPDLHAKLSTEEKKFVRENLIKAWEGEVGKYKLEGVNPYSEALEEKRKSKEF